MTAPERAPMGAALALLLALITMAGPSSPVLVAAAMAVLSLLIGVAWPDLLELPSPRGTRVIVIGVGALSAVVAVAADGRISPVTGVVMVCAAGVFAAFVHQMARRDRRDLTASLTGTVAGLLVTGIAACWVLAQHQAEESGRTWMLTAVALGLAVTLLLDATPLPALARFLLSSGAGFAVTATLAMTVAGRDPFTALAMGLLVAVGASCSHLLAGSSLVAREPVPSLAVAAVPVATVGVVSHLAVALLT